MSDKNSVVVVFGTHMAAERAVQELQRSGFGMKKLSIIGKGSKGKDDVVGSYTITSGDRMTSWGLSGAFWGGMCGALFGSALVVIPGIGPLIAAGPVAAWMIGVLEGAVVGTGFGVVGAALCSIGIPTKSILQYETALKAGQFLLIAHGTPDEVTRAKKILDQTPGAASTLHLEVPLENVVRS